MNKTWILILFLIIVIITLVILIWWVPKSSPPSTTEKPIASTQPVIFDPRKIDQNAKEFSIIGVTPNPTQIVTDRFTPFEITFNQQVIDTSVKVTTIPNLKIQTNLYHTKIGSSVLEIIPIDPWQDQISYQIILNKDLQTKDGVKLGKDYIINFKIEAYLGL